MAFRLYHLPFAITSLIIGTTVITFYLSYVQYKHVTYILPYISDTGTFPPESCIFGQALNVAALLIGVVIYIKYLQVKELVEKHPLSSINASLLNKVTLFFGLTASLGISFVANFQETNTFYFHWFGASLTFGGGAVYLTLQTILYVKISHLIGQEKTTRFRIFVAFITAFTFCICVTTAFLSYQKFTGGDITKWKIEDGGYRLHQVSTVCEWICATGMLTYISLFRDEFKNIEIDQIRIFFKD
ncbi:hypothetical protein ABEB36_008607 [Hypothenemus hampei]|uniref:CWH43-like N-terminal domain-containing protein n=1 Tax=Hypothenemus hampei TaxID=57062 RepID=A0ABD1EMG2_HYPHA